MLHNAFSFVKESAGIEAYQLKSNGLQVLLLQDVAAPVVVFMVTYRVGSRNEGPGTTGATHILEHLMFKGTEQFHKSKGTSIFNTLQRLGAKINATTWLDRTNYYELLPKAHLEEAVRIEADRMRNALIAEDDFASERTVILNEFDRGDNEPIRKLYQSVWSTAFTAHPYHHPTIGWRSDIEHITREQLCAFYDTFYWPNNATVTLIGDFEKEEGLGLVEKHFGAIPPAPHPIPEVYTREPAQRGERRVIIRQAGELGTVMQAYKMPNALHEDADALGVLAQILGSGKTSRLYQALVDQGLATHVTTSASRLRDPGLFLLYAMLSATATHEQVEAILDEEIQRLQTEGITEIELERAKSKVRAHEAFSRDGSYSVAAQLNEAIAAGDWTLYTTYLNRIQQVTTDDVQRVAQTYLIPDSRTVGYYIPS